MDINKVSRSVVSQSPDFIESDYPLFNRFLEYYYKSQEKTGLGQNILNNFLEYLNIDKLNVDILGSFTKLVEPISTTSDTIVVETTDKFLEKNGSILIGDEIIFYENTSAAPNIALSPGVSYEQVKLKWTILANIIDSFDGVQRRFPLVSQDSPIAPPSPQHLIVSVYGETLVPVVDYNVDGTNIVFTTAPRERIPADDNGSTSIAFLSGFVENAIIGIDNISNAFGDGKTEFSMTSNSVKYEPIVDEYVIAIYDNKLLVPKVDYFIDRNQFIFNVAPLKGRFLSLYSIEAPIPSFGNGATGYARVDDLGQITKIVIDESGSDYRFEYPPKVTINSESGTGAAAKSLVNGIKSISLLNGGRGYSDTNPPIVVVENPTKPGSIPATISAVVTNGSVSQLNIDSSGSGYTFTPRITFRQPGGAILGQPTIVGGSISGEIEIIDTGLGYTTAPTVYVDEPTGENGIKASLRTVLTDGAVTGVEVLNAGQGYETVPRIKILDPVGAQVLETIVDGDGRVINIELLSGGSGYDDVPSVYIVDERTTEQGLYIGGTGATAVASIFNGQITDINITNFGTGYSSDNPPKIVIQSPPSAKASAEVGLNEVTGFVVNKSGLDYSKAEFQGCARAANGILDYTEDGNVIFSQDTVAAAATIDTEVKCLDALFVKRLLDKYTEQFLPDVPRLDYSKIDVRTAIKSIKDFYSSKGTQFSISYLFKLLYGETVSVSYPKFQIIKPSAATWSIDTVLRATLVSGDPQNIKDGLLTQDEDIADPNIKNASALVENFLAIKTEEQDIYELVLSEETITGNFTVPYKTRLAEPLGTDTSIITVDSTIGWPERNGEFVIGGTELVQYKEKSLNQFIECTRSANGIVEDWDSATGVTSNFQIYINKGTAQEVVMNIVGIVDAQQTNLTDTGSYYLPGDKLSVSKLGGTGDEPELTTWLYNVKKLVQVENITFGGINNQSATVTCSNPHGLLVGDQVTVYGANPIIYNGTFLVTSRDTQTVFQYQLPQPATVVPQGNILVSVDLNKGKSDSSAVLNAVGPYTTNIQNTFFNDNYVYVASTGIPNYNIGPFPGSALLPGNQRKLNRFPKNPVTISTKNSISPGPIGTWVNGVSVWSYKSPLTKTFGAITDIAIDNPGSGYDAASPPSITIAGGGGTGATASVIVDGSISEINVINGGSGYTSSPLVSIVGGNGSGAAATAIITKGVVSRILINNGGTGYTSQPSITIVGGGGTGATAEASVRGPIQSISINNGGVSYTSKPTVTLSSGEGAVAQAIVNDGRIISIAIISAGQGYTTAPEVSIQGDGFGAVARAVIDVDGENAGRVTGIQIINRGIGYSQGTTVVNLTSVGQDALFSANVFQWTYNLQETETFDSAKGSVFEGYNNQYGGEYAHLSNPQRLRYILGDNLFVNASGQILEQEDQLDHSPIIGWAFDGNPIYGPYGYEDPTNQSSSIVRLGSSFRLKTNLVYDGITNPYPERISGPLLTEDTAGTFIEDYEYIFNLGDLDQYNGRFCKTPEFPDGRYCYFVTIDATENGNPVYPYIIGSDFNSVVDKWNLSSSAIQQNIPTGVVRYRDPYENVDIDVERIPNASTNALTTEDGDILLFDIEDENRDGVISQDEIDDPDQLFEESPLQLFDYFPKVKLDSKVDIEVETITKFEDASVTGFIVENPGISYQVNDRLTFDNTGTGGNGVSARVSRIRGEEIESYSFENISGNNFGVLTTTQPHNLQVGDSIFIDYEPIMDNTNKTFIVRQFRGIEEIVIDQTGSGYNEDIPPSILIDGDGNSGKLEAIVSSVGSIDTINIINSGYGYQSNPRVILSHPQIFKKADYYVSFIENNRDTKVNDVVVNENKESFVCGKTVDDVGDTIGFVAKLSSTGVKEWEKTLKLNTGESYTEFKRLYVDGNDIWVTGENRPNSALLTTYNPDVILVKYEQSDNGLDANLILQKGYAGISGNTRSDNVTTIKKYSDIRTIIGGYTNTNSSNPYDAFVALIDTSGNFSIKRKFASNSQSEKLTDVVVNGTTIYFTLETSTSNTSNDINVSFGRAEVLVNSIEVVWIKEISNSLYSFLDSSIVIDEFDELYVTSTLRLKSDHTTKDSVWVGKFDTDGGTIWNYRYLIPGRSVDVTAKTTIDIFNDLNVALSGTDNNNGLKTVDTLKISYDGTLKNQTKNTFNKNRIEGLTSHTISSDISGDVYVFGQTSWNRNEFIFEFGETDDATDKTGHYTPTLIGNDATDSLTLAGDGVAKLIGEDIGNPGTWENAAIKFASADLGVNLAGDWTIEFMLYKDSANSQTQSQTEQTLLSIGDAADSTGGLWLYYDMGSGYLELIVTNNTTTINSASSGLQSAQSNMYADNSWQFIGLKKSGNVFTGYVNGIQVFTGSVANTSLGNKDLYIGNISGRDGTPGTFRSNEQGQFYIDNLRLRNREVTPTVPSDVLSLPPSASFVLAYDWVDDDWFTTNFGIYDYIDYESFGIKVDKNADSVRIGDFGEQENTNIGLVRTEIVPSIGSALTLNVVGFDLGNVGLQSLDFDDANTTMSQDTDALSYSRDIWSSRTATVPSPGSQKLKVTAVVKDRYYFKVTNTIKIDNIQILTLNQPFNFTLGTKLVLNDGATFVNSGYIVKNDPVNNQIYVAVNNNAWSDDTNIGTLSTEQFDEQDTYGIVGPIPADVNVIKAYTFSQVNNTTPGTFDIDLSEYDAPADVGGSNNLDEYAKFKPYSDDDYSIRIDEVSASSYIVGSVITIDPGDISYNAEYSTAQITGLAGVLKITLITNLDKILQVSSVANSDEVYVITDTSHYLTAGEMIYVDGNPSQTVGPIVYDEYDGSFPVDTVISPLEFTYKLPNNAITSPATNASSVSIFVKSPVLKMYYGHQYLFDLSHSSLLGGNLSFSKDNLNKLEYSFNSIERIGTPGVTGQGQPTPTVKLKVDKNIVTNISYYFDPSRVGADSPIISGSYLDVVYSPYVGAFEISSVDGATITRGADIVKFPLLNEPEGNADVSTASYSTSSLRAIGSIADIRIVNPGGFYSRLPIITGIESTRKIERVQINEPGTEYAVGTYNGVPISGDGEGGLVSITVADGTDDEGVLIPGQIQNITVTSPGKNYTTATIDIESIDGILGPGLTGSGAEVEVIIPDFGTGATIFTKGENVGKIKNLKNNNFGYDYPHDYTLRPEITFPINAQLISTSILDSITVTDPGSGYSLAPAVVITGGGGSGAIAEAIIKNGRLDQIIVKDPGAGYSSTPTVELKSSFNYVINLDLGLLQFAFPHGIPNGAEVTLNVIDTGDGADFPLSAGAIGRLNGNTTYFAIAGAENSLDNDQLKLAITAANAELGDAITFVNAGEGRQQVLTSSFGGAASANVITSTFLEGEFVYQGDSVEVATATGYVSTNNGWQVGPRVLKIVDYDGDFVLGQKITGVISKSSGVISDLNIAKGVLEIGSITKTTGQFTDDVGKPSEIIQKIQDSYYYQDFSYAVKSAVSINEWKDILIRNVHPASFKVFGELNLNEYGFVPNKETFFQLTKSVELAQEAIVPNIQNFALVEPIYSEFNNTEVLFRQRRLTSSENILTSVVQRVDDISSLFDGQRISFPLTVDGENVIANANQLMIILNGVVQTPEVSFQIQGDSIVFSEPPSPPASVKYVNVTIDQIDTQQLSFTNISGIFPNVGNTLVGSVSGVRFTVTSVVGDIISGFISEGSSFVPGEFCIVNETGFSANLDAITDIQNLGLFTFGEQIRNFDGDTAIVEEINLERGAEIPIAKLRYGIGSSTTSFEVIDLNAPTDSPVAAGTFIVGENYQFGSEIFTVNSITDNNESSTLVVTRAQAGTAATSKQEDIPIYGTQIEVTNSLTLSKTAGTYQSTPGLFDIQLNDIIIAASSGVVARITSTATYQDPTTLEFIGQVNISEGSSFFGLLFNRITSITYPNIVLDDISQSQVSIVDYTDNESTFNLQFPANERINNYVIPYDNASGDLQEDEYIRNFKIEYGNNVGEFSASEDLKIRKLTFKNKKGTGFFQAGQVVRTKDTKAEVLGYNQARSTIYFGKIGRTQATGEDYHEAVFNNSAQLSIAQAIYGSTSLLLDDATSDHLSIVTSTDFGFGTGAFTLECWIRPDDVSAGDRHIFDMRDSGGDANAGRLYIATDQVRFNIGGSDVVTSGVTTLSADTWYHVAISRSGTTLKLFVDGVEVDSTTNSTDLGSTKRLFIGSNFAGSNTFSGHIDEFVVSNTGRYTADFPTPLGISQGDINTKLLLHLDGVNGQTYTDDWSGSEGFTNGEFITNDAILATTRENAADVPSGFVGRSQRYLDAADLILENRTFVAEETVYLLKQQYPSLVIPNGDQNCKDDIYDILTELANDLRNGSNSHIWDASTFYVDRTQNPVTLNHVESEITETLWAYNKVDEILQYIINNTPWTVQGDHGKVQFTDTTITDSSYTVLTTLTPTDATYDPATGDFVITVGSHGLTTNDIVSLAPESFRFTCSSDGNDRELAHPRPSDTLAYNRVLTISAVTPNTFTVNVGVSPESAQFAHTFVSVNSDAVTVLNYSTADCADVYTTINNLIDILTDTLSEADTPTNTVNGDHLGTITRVAPEYEFLGGTVDAFLEVPFTASYHDGTNDILYTNRIDENARNRFYDAAELITKNASVIVDKASADLLDRYPDLISEMPRNQTGTGDGTLRCKTDLTLILNEIIKDIKDGGNLNTVRAAKFYLGNNDELIYIRLQVFQSVYAHKRLGFYMKQAITGDLTYDNTDDIIVGDWGITNDPGGCQNVQDAIDGLIDVVNDIIAPTASDFEIAADRLHFNSDYLAEEIVGSTNNYLTYFLNGVSYSVYSYDQDKCKRDLKYLIKAMISDLQTGGNNSTIANMEFYLNADLTLNYIEEELLPTIYAIEQIKIIGEHALRNELYDFGEFVTGTQYAAQYTSVDAYRDSESPSNVDQLVYRLRDLVDIAVNILSPSGDIGRSAAKQIVYNKNYYKQEISQIVTTQFGSGLWQYDSFIDDLMQDLAHDIITTDTSVSSTAYTITLESVSDIFEVGEIVTSSGTGTAEVLEYDPDNEILYIGEFTGTDWVAADTLTGADSGATATISTGGVSSSYDWYTNPTNVETLSTARLITSNISGQISGTNLWTNPEAIDINWTVSPIATLTITSDSIAAPDGTINAEKIFPPNLNGGTHYLYRDYNLNAYETFDTDSLRFDTDGETFDTGNPGTSQSQTFTFSAFFKSAGSQSVRFQVILDDGTAAEQNAFFDLNLNTGVTGSAFTPQGSISVDAYGAVPVGDGWYRAYITTTFSYGFSSLRGLAFVNSALGAQIWTGDGTTGIYMWGTKLNSGELDPYTSQSGQVFYSDNEYNIKTFTIQLLNEYVASALRGSLVSPSPESGFYSYYDSTITSDYTAYSIDRLVRYSFNIIANQLASDSYFTTIVVENGISLPSKEYGIRNMPVGLSGGTNASDYIYGTLTDAYAELENTILNEGKIVKVYKRFRIDGDITDGPFTMNENVFKQGSPSITGIVYGFFEDQNFKYLDVEVTAGPWAVTDTIVGAENSTTAQISSIEDRIQIIDLIGDFEDDIPFLGYSSEHTATPTGFLKTEAAVTDNAGGKLTVDTETLVGSFETTSVVYPESSRKYIDVSQFAGLEVSIGSRIASEGYVRFGISIINNLNDFTEGNRLYKVVSGIQDPNSYAVITEIDLDNNYLYVSVVQGTFSNGDIVGDYGLASNFPVGYASISTSITVDGAASAIVQDIRTIGITKRLYIADISGTFFAKDSIKSINGYRAAILDIVDLKARVDRAFKGFDGTQTTFDLSIENGTQYFPDPAGHMLIFVNGILQPPGANNAYTAFSNKIQFSEAPDIGSSFTGFYIGKLRQLDDISFEFDSLRQSFNLKRNEVFYSLTLTDGIQSSIIRPENNIIVSLNGVIQEPGVGFEIVGSRIIFSEIPRVGSTFVAFSYVGSEADVDAAEVVPPIEAGDFIDIEGEVEDREVAVIESSNSLITFDYLGSVFGQGARAQSVLTKGYIDSVAVTSGGSGYTSRPTVRIDSISGFDGNIRALVGVANIEVNTPGSGYKNPDVLIETEVPDDWTAPNLEDYGEELVDPEVIA